jgi:cysteine desulfurase/selenocysteine lyase
MDVASRGLLPASVKAAVDQQLESRIYGSADKAKMFDIIARVRGRYAGLINADPDEIAFTKNVSEGLNLVASAIPWKPSDNVILCPELEHPSNIYPWLNLRSRFGIEVRTVRPRNGRIQIGEIASRIDGRTRAVTTSLVTFAPGFRTEIEALAKFCQERGVLLLVDGAQGVGILHIDMATLPISAMSVSTQKGLLGLYGMGFLYVRRDWAERLAPPFLSRFSVDLGSAHEATGGIANYELMPGARRFEVGNYNFIGATAVEPGLNILADIGTEAIQAHVLSLATRMIEGLRNLGIPVFGGEPGPHRAHMVAIGTEIGGEHDATSNVEMRSLYDALWAGGVRLSIRRGILRISLHLYNNEEDVDRLLAIAREWRAERVQTAAE